MNPENANTETMPGSLAEKSFPLLKDGESQLRSSRQDRLARTLSLALAGFMGAAGVAASAAGSHTGGANLALAGQFLLIHAAAACALCAASVTTEMSGGQTRLNAGARGALPRAFLLAAGILTAGTLIFAADLTCRALWSTRLFPYAAPAGGLLMMAGWLTACVAGLAMAVRNDRG